MMSKEKKPTVAICYDFDGTLSPLYMQEYGFFLGLPKKEREGFWNRSNATAKANGADPILQYMKLMVDETKAYTGTARATREAFRDYGKNVQFFKGVEKWFKRIKKYAKAKGVIVEHYIISSGLKEMVEGTSIGKFFKQIYACSFIYENGIASWPAQVVNFTTKTQYLFRINKGEEDISSSEVVNSFIEQEKRPVPFHNMIYIGDGETDVPCMRVVKAQGGHSIAVYNPRKKRSKANAEKLYAEGRVNYVIQADYSEGRLLDRVIKSIIDKIAAQSRLDCVSLKAIPQANNEPEMPKDKGVTCDDVQDHIEHVDALPTSQGESSVLKRD